MATLFWGRKAKEARWTFTLLKVSTVKDKWPPQNVCLSQRESTTAENEQKLSSVTGREAGAATEALTPHTSPTVLKAVAIATTKVLQQQKRGCVLSQF